MKLQFYKQIHQKYSYIKFNENPFSGSRAVLFGRIVGQTNTTKLIVAFDNFANVPKTGYAIVNNLYSILKKIIAWKV